MEAERSSYFLEVVGGDDHGARLEVDSNVRTIGRSRDVDLPLRDAGISRRHVQVAATETGVQFDVCGGAAEFILGGRALRSAEAKEGDRVLLGSTIAAARAGTPTSERC
jgi:pSer/pThr/pTyr-binding forkhead associated (FHA) protein